MSTYVLVHGAWRGSWIWKRVRCKLQVHGHEVFTPTLTGVGERSHSLAPQVNLETHIADVINLIRWEELSDVILCGHSYGGCVVTCVADRIPEKISALVYLDAFVPENGQSLHDTLPPEVRNEQIEGARKIGKVGRRLQFPPKHSTSMRGIETGWTANPRCILSHAFNSLFALRMESNRSKMSVISWRPTGIPHRSISFTKRLKLGDGGRSPWHAVTM
jgi:pimeloyl-ACP methyl ester carboxylesterase